MRFMKTAAVLAIVILSVVVAASATGQPDVDAATKSAVIDGATYNLMDTYEATYVQSPSGPAITVPSSVTYQGKEYTVTGIGSNAFKSKAGIVSVALPDTVVSIPSSCFNGCSSLASVDLGGVTAIPSSCFAGTAFTSVSMDNVASVGSSAFKLCSSLETVSLPDAASVGSMAFQNCTSLVSALMPSVLSIDSQAFAGCTSLASADISKASSLGSKAFAGCTSLSHVSCGSLTALKSEAFSGCSSMTSFDLSGIRSIENSVFSGTSIPEPLYFNSVLVYVPSSIAAYEFPSFVSVIGGGAFENVAMDELVVPDHVGNIHDNAFMKSGIKRIVLSDSLVAIGSGAFQSSGIESISIPPSIDYLAYRTFNNCKSLVEVHVPDSVEQVGDEVFSGCSALGSVVLPDSIKALGSKMFYDCDSLTEVVCGGVEQYGAECFSGCNSLTTFALNPGSVMGEKMFNKCTSLVEVVLPEDLESIPDQSFSGCVSLTSIDLAGVRHVGVRAFNGSGLTEIVFPASMPYDALESYSMAGAKSLVSVQVLAPYLMIPNQCFNGCTSLKTIDVHGTIGVASSAFINCASLDDFIVRWRVPFDIVDGFSSNPLKNLVKTDSGNSCKYIDVTYRTEVGDSPSRVAISSSDESSTTLRIGDGYCGASYSLISSVLSKESPSLVASDPSFEFDGKALYVGDALVFTRPSSGSAFVQDGTITICPKSLDGFSSASTLTIPGSVTSILASAVSEAGGVGLDGIYLYSSPVIASGAFPSVSAYYLHGVYDGAASSELPMSGQFVDIGGFHVVFEVNDVSACELTVVSGDDSIAFSFDANEAYDRSVPTVTSVGAQVVTAPEGTTIGGVDVSGMYLIEGIGSAVVVHADGYAVNRYDILAPVGDGFEFRADALEDIEHGRAVRFSVLLMPGYVAGDGFAVRANADPVLPSIISRAYRH